MLFLDFETFNLCLNSEFNLPWQAALILLEGEEEICSHDLYLKWDSDLKIGKEAKRITRYSDITFDEKCIPEKEGFDIVYELVEKCDYIVGHNFLGFDIYLLRDWYRKHKKDYTHLTNKVIDTFAIAKAVAIDYSYKEKECEMLDFQIKMINFRKKGIKTNLAALGRSYGIDHEYDNLHNALVDLELNIKVWDKLKYQIDF